MTNYPNRKILSKPNLSGRLIKWAIKLGVYDIRYAPRTTKKVQVMAYFLVKIQCFEPLEKEIRTLLEEVMR